MIRLNNLQKEYKGFKLDITMDVPEGRVTGLIGRNGAGKTTTIKCILGLVRPTAGEAEVFGRNPRDLTSDERQMIGVALSESGFSMLFTLEDVIKVLSASYKDFDEKRFRDMCSAQSLPFDKQIKDYSSGMKARLGFAINVNIEPEILIVDEALSVGDVFFQAKCYHKFEEFKAQGKTILFVSHDLSSIAKYCDRVILLNKGVKLGEGDPKEMIDAYKQVLVGQYHVPDQDDNNLLEDEQIKEKAANGAINPAAIEYGNGAAHIRDYYITDKNGTVTTAIIKGEEWTIHYTVDFTQDVKAPIFAFTVKNIRGTEITGTNSMYEKAFLKRKSHLHRKWISRVVNTCSASASPAMRMINLMFITDYMMF